MSGLSARAPMKGMQEEQGKFQQAVVRGSVARKPLSTTETEQLRSEQAAWASRERSGPSPYEVAPSSRQASLNGMQRMSLARAGGYVPFEDQRMKLGMRRGR